jgi:hypothetical protein
LVPRQEKQVRISAVRGRRGKGEESDEERSEVMLGTGEMLLVPVIIATIVGLVLWVSSKKSGRNDRERNFGSRFRKEERRPKVIPPELEMVSQLVAPNVKTEWDARTSLPAASYWLSCGR